jgi:hypothetical protein
MPVSNKLPISGRAVSEAERIVLVMDNLTAHKGDKVKWLIEARG